MTTIGVVVAEFNHEKRHFCIIYIIKNDCVVKHNLLKNTCYEICAT